MGSSVSCNRHTAAPVASTTPQERQLSPGSPAPPLNESPQPRLPPALIHNEEPNPAPPAAPFDMSCVDSGINSESPSQDTSPRNLLSTPQAGECRKPSADSVFSTGDFSLNSQEVWKEEPDCNSPQQRVTSLGSGFGSLTGYIQDAAGSNRDLGRARIGPPPTSSPHAHRRSSLRRNAEVNYMSERARPTLVPSPTGHH